MVPVRAFDRSGQGQKCRPCGMGCRMTRTSPVRGNVGRCAPCPRPSAGLSRAATARPLTFLLVLNLVAWLSGGCATWSVADQQLADGLSSSDSAQASAAAAGGASPNITYGNGLRPLSVAVLHNDKASVRALLDAGADPNFFHPAKSLEGVVRARVLDAQLKAGSRDPQLAEGLSLLALVSDAEMMRLLVSGGADPNFRDQLGATPLFHAASDGNADLVKVLTELGADPNLAEASGRTPLAMALQFGRTTVIAALLDAGADPDSPDWRGRNALHSAAMIPSGFAIPLLIRPGLDLNARDAEGSTALILAARDGYAGAVRALLAAGADANVRDAAGYTALDWATAKEHTGVAAMLAAAGASQPQAEVIEKVRSGKARPTATNALVVYTSSVMTDGRHLKIRGRVENPHNEAVRGIRYRVSLLNRESNRVLDTFFEERDDTEIPAEGGAALRLDIASMYAATGGIFAVEAIPMRIGDRDVPGPPEWRGRD